MPSPWFPELSVDDKPEKTMEPTLEEIAEMLFIEATRAKKRVAILELWERNQGHPVTEEQKKP